MNNFFTYLDTKKYTLKSAQELEQELHDTLSLDTPLDNKSDFIEAVTGVFNATRPTRGKNFHNLLFGGADTSAVLADMLTPVMNVTMHTYKSGGVHILLENEIIQKMIQKIGWTNGDGVITSGGSISNLYGMLLARNNADPLFQEQGKTKELSCYASELSHYSVVKNASVSGIGKQSIHFIPTDDAGRMDSIALEESIKKDIKEGKKPSLLHITSGTTVRGSFDNIKVLSNIARAYGMWVHVDITWGSGVFFNSQLQRLIDGIDAVDSVAWNPHKFMGIPLTASVFLTQKRHALKDAFRVDSEYLFQTESITYNPGLKTLQCGRRNDAFKIWAAWKQGGDKKFEEKMDTLLALRNYMLGIIKNNKEIILFEEPQYLNVCFRLEYENAKESCLRLESEYGIRVSHAHIDGQDYIRFIFVNNTITKKDIDFFISSLLKK